ncbi:MAG: ETEC_3214 domain-containing protein [Marinagarivorans sp.]
MSEENIDQKSNKRFWLLAGLGGLIVATVLGVFLYQKSLGNLSAQEAEVLTQKLNQLKLGVDVGYFSRQLGEPKLKESKTLKMVSVKIIHHAPPKKEVREVLYSEYYYANPYFYVQAIANQSGVVEFYSITARSERFQPKIKTGLNEFVELGKTLYQTLPKSPYKVAGRLTENPKNTAYYEIFVLDSSVPKLEIYSTNPTGYLKSTVALDEKKEGFLVSKLNDETPFPTSPAHDAYRRATPVNTYSAVAAEFEGIDASAEGMNFDEAKINFGPRVDQLEKLQ